MDFTRLTLTYGSLGAADGEVSPEIVDRFKTLVAAEGPFDVILAGADVDAATRAVNVGIDSHLQAIACKWVWDARGRLHADLSAEDLTIFVRRLVEDGADDALDLASSILTVIGVEWV